jgi:hypothetical protein
LVGLNLVFGRSGLWLGLVGAALLQCKADVGPLSLTTGSSSSGLTAKLGWTPSPSTNVTGYFLNWGLATGQCTNQLDAGSVTNITVGGLATNITYYFNVVAYDAAGDVAPPSNELGYTPHSPPSLTAQLQGSGQSARTVGLNFQATAGGNYAIQATQDFQQWVTVWTTNCLVNGPVAYAASDPASYPRRFYRVVQQ